MKRVRGAAREPIHSESRPPSLPAVRALGRSRFLRMIVHGRIAHAGLTAAGGVAGEVKFKLKLAIKWRGGGVNSHYDVQVETAAGSSTWFRLRSVLDLLMGCIPFETNEKSRWAAGV